jgi:tRNA A37 threonylcarbamoyladenosine modification protein TsaB
LAYNKETGKSVCVIDAKHDNFYAQLFDGNKSISEPMFITKAELLEYSKEYNILTSSDIEICKSNCNLQLGFNNAIKSKLNESTIDRELILPLYVRKSQAEENK